MFSRLSVSVAKQAGKNFSTTSQVKNICKTYENLHKNSDSSRIRRVVVVVVVGLVVSFT